MSINVPRTFLELVQRTRQECQVPGTGPLTVERQSGILGRLVSWVSTAWIDLQSFHPNWRFMRNEVTWTLNAGENEKTAEEIVGSDSLREWIRTNFRAYNTASGVQGERTLAILPYDAFRAEYIFGTNRDNRGEPTTITVSPDNSIIVYPTPDAQHTIIGEYHRAAQEMTDDDDEPNIPVEFRIVLVYAAAAEYGRYEAANEVYQHFNYRYNRVMRQLEASQLPRPSLAGASGLG